MRDKLAEILENSTDADHEMLSTADAIIAALPGMIKPLDWVQGESMIFAVGYTIRDVGLTGSGHEKMWAAYADNGKHIPSSTGSMGAAKDAVHARRTRRIMEAFGL
ncbi:MAG: hypothetical protein JKY32_07150 [Rhizobiales bacterium]|nr:hypothetical protein [Hyphomicrobiales bacterium]